jgi:glycerol uptake facilitator-like aquaporin
MDGDYLWVALVGAFFGALMAWAAVDSSWRDDCKNLGSHLSSGRVYECSVKP